MPEKNISLTNFFKFNYVFTEIIKNITSYN